MGDRQIPSSPQQPLAAPSAGLLAPSELIARAIPGAPGSARARHPRPHGQHVDPQDTIINKTLILISSWLAGWLATGFFIQKRRRGYYKPRGVYYEGQLHTQY